MRSILVSLMMLFIASTAMAQNFSIGLNAASASVWPTSSDGYYTAVPTNSVDLGINSRIHFGTKGNYFQLSLNIVKRASDFNSEHFGTSRISESFLQLPVSVSLLKVHLKETQWFSFDAGMYFSLAMNQEVYSSEIDETDKNLSEYSAFGDYFKAGALAAINYNIEVNPKSLFWIGIEGMTDIASLQNLEDDNPSRDYRVGMFRIGYLMRLWNNKKGRPVVTGHPYTKQYIFILQQKAKQNTGSNSTPNNAGDIRSHSVHQ